MSTETETHNRMHLAGLAMMGLLADHKDHEDERRFHFEDMRGNRVDPDVANRHKIPHKQVFDETCAQAVARLAVEHADALIAALAVADAPAPMPAPSVLSKDNIMLFVKQPRKVSEIELMEAASRLMENYEGDTVSSVAKLLAVNGPIDVFDFESRMADRVFVCRQCRKHKDVSLKEDDGRCCTCNPHAEVAR